MDFSTNEWRTKVFYSLPTGWWMRFGDQLCDDIEHTVKKMMAKVQLFFSHERKNYKKSKPIPIIDNYRNSSAALHRR